ncbi:hypothetical protein ACRALDRAFT_1081926 [Sodiomyces alcalophilus JCM 7366]|uniref:uncharacterized protein n=1 Tax=Sodiomyces alcalophilus JCM 7366 TaxID=591952 RepID=UPI0039B54574
MKFQAATILLSALSAMPAAAQNANPRAPNPLDQAKATIVESFKWRDPFTSQTTDNFDAACEVTKVFTAEQYTLHQLYDKQPLGLWSYVEGLKDFFTEREYPGGFSGLDRHGWDRNVLLMHYDTVPIQVREWIEEQTRTESEHYGLFATFKKPEDKHQKVTEQVAIPKDGPVDREEDKDKVILFAPGALYEILPLFVAESSDCKDELLDLSKYTPEPKDGAVIAWPISHTRPSVREKRREIEITIKAQVLKEKEGGAEEAKESKDEL